MTPCHPDCEREHIPHIVCRDADGNGLLADDQISIEWAAVPNARGSDHGWLPAVWRNGRLITSPWAFRGYDEHDARGIAQREAEEEAARYVGDWHVTVRERQIGPHNSP